jgi:mono/diheme cytochrome c family protein
MRHTEREKENSMNAQPIPVAELGEIETHAIRRSEELLIDWENCIHGKDNLAAAHAYAALALAAGQRIARLSCEGCHNGCDGCS